ncbi:hypothetical protein [Streptomyces sp. NPDC055287]
MDVVVDGGESLDEEVEALGVVGAADRGDDRAVDGDGEPAHDAFGFVRGRWGEVGGGEVETGRPGPELGRIQAVLLLDVAGEEVADVRYPGAGVEVGGGDGLFLPGDAAGVGVGAFGDAGGGEQGQQDVDLGAAASVVGESCEGGVDADGQYLLVPVGEIPGGGRLRWTDAARCPGARRDGWCRRAITSPPSGPTTRRA